MTQSILTCSPHFSDLALNELTRQHSDITIQSELSPGCILLRSSVSFNKLTRPWRRRLPIYLHHMCPVHVSVPLGLTRADLRVLGELTRERFQSRHAVAVQPRVLIGSTTNPETVFPYTEDDIVQMVDEELSDRMRAGTSQTRKVLSIVIAEAGKAYLGLSWPGQNLSPWPGGVNPYCAGMPNRAGYKLIEALETFQISLRSGDRALDLGAAPGAWTMVLRQHGMVVIAVAPREMYPVLRRDPMVHHRQMRAEDYLHHAEGTFDLITNDMYMDARDSARLMISYAKFLRTQGIAIMTLKLYGQNRRRVMDHSYWILRKAYKIIRVRQLVSNRKEVTLFLRRLV